jgi:hypothetical protein
VALGEALPNEALEPGKPAFSSQLEGFLVIGTIEAGPQCEQRTDPVAAGAVYEDRSRILLQQFVELAGAIE